MLTRWRGARATTDWGRDNRALQADRAGLLVTKIGRQRSPCLRRLRFRSSASRTCSRRIVMRLLQGSERL
jgi:hypothetical protein